jgi:hypothetical protein
LIIYSSGKLTLFLLKHFAWGGKEGFTDTEPKNEQKNLLHENVEPREHVRILTAREIKSK